MRPDAVSSLSLFEDVLTIMLTTAESEVSMVVWIYDCYRAVVCHQCVADHAALSQAKKIRRSRSRPYSEHGNLAGRGLWWPLISPQAGRPELATETPEKPQSHGNMGGRQPAVIAGYLRIDWLQACTSWYTTIRTDKAVED